MQEIKNLIEKLGSNAEHSRQANFLPNVFLVLPKLFQTLIKLAYASQLMVWFVNRSRALILHMFMYVSNSLHLWRAAENACNCKLPLMCRNWTFLWPDCLCYLLGKSSYISFPLFSQERLHNCSSNLCWLSGSSPSLCFHVLMCYGGSWRGPRSKVALHQFHIWIKMSLQILTWHRFQPSVAEGEWRALPSLWTSSCIFVSSPNTLQTKACLSSSLIPAMLSRPCSMDPLALPRGLWTYKFSLATDRAGAHGMAKVMRMGRDVLGTLLARVYS